VATNQAKQSEPRTTTHKKDFLFYSEPISDIPNFAQKKKSLASTTNLRSMIGLKHQAPKNRIMDDEPRTTQPQARGKESSLAIQRNRGREMMAI
jgi:hypothetical protein